MKQQMNKENVFAIKFSEEQIIEFSKRPPLKDLKNTKFLDVGDFVCYDFKFYGFSMIEYGVVDRIYHTFFHNHKRIKVLFYHKWKGKFYSIFDEKGDLL